ncbi:MAG: hypothetical protein ACTHX0_11140, partial [Brachybacterium sp.]
MSTLDLLAESGFEAAAIVLGPEAQRARRRGVDRSRWTWTALPACPGPSGPSGPPGLPRPSYPRSLRERFRW